MKLITQHRNLRSTDELDSLLEERILAFEPRLQIDEARVRLECNWEESPACRVAIHIVAPLTCLTISPAFATISPPLIV